MLGPNQPAEPVMVWGSPPGCRRGIGRHPQVLCVPPSPTPQDRKRSAAQKAVLVRGLLGRWAAAIVDIPTAVLSKRPANSTSTLWPPSEAKQTPPRWARSRGTPASSDTSLRASSSNVPRSSSLMPALERSSLPLRQASHTAAFRSARTTGITPTSSLDTTSASPRAGPARCLVVPTGHHPLDHPAMQSAASTIKDRFLAMPHPRDLVTTLERLI